MRGSLGSRVNSVQTARNASFRLSNEEVIIAFSIRTTYSENGRRMFRIFCTCFVGLHTPFSTRVPQKSKIMALVISSLSMGFLFIFYDTFCLDTSYNPLTIYSTFSFQNSMNNEDRLALL